MMLDPLASPPRAAAHPRASRTHPRRLRTARPQTLLLESRNSSILEFAGAALNNLTVAGDVEVDAENCGAANENTSAAGAAVFGGTHAIVASADQVSHLDVAAALRAAGVAQDAVNAVVFPSSRLDLGTGPSSSYLLLGSRAGPFETERAKFEYAAAVVEPFQLFRAESRPAPPELAPTPAAKPRGPTNRTEHGLQVLDDAISQRHNMHEK